MTDLTKITTPFGLLDKETQEALKAHGGPYEFYMGRIYGGGWSKMAHKPTWTNEVTYRVAHQPFDWSPVWALLKEDYRWLAMDEDGDWWAYEGPPTHRAEGTWGGVQAVILTALKLPTDIPWEDSLMERPDG